MSRRNAYRPVTRLASRRLGRCRNRRCLRGRRRGPDDLTSALTAMGRALWAHRRLARLAPSFFDPAVVAREAENRAEQRRWMATWEPALAKVYGVEHQPAPVTDDLPPLPSPRVQRAVDLKLAEVHMWLEAGDVALKRHQRRRPHELMSLSRMARLLALGVDLKRMACGLDSPNPLPEKILYDYELTDLKRGYGHLMKTPEATAPAPVVPGPVCQPSSPIVPPPSPPPPLPPPLPPAPPRCDAWSRWARTMRRLKS